MDHSIMAVSGSEMSAEEKFRIVRSIGDECIQDGELRSLLANKPQPICYDRFEPSGRMHIAQGVMKTINVNKLTSAGCKVKILMADWFVRLNNKKNGDLKEIEVVGQSMIHIWKAMGMNVDQVEFLWSWKEINSRMDEYLHLVLDIARRTPLKRVKSCCQIMPGSDGDNLPAAQILHPLMQCADIFFFKADICQLGLDQREVNILAREYSDAIERKNKPIILSHHLLAGLKGLEKMSKSDPDSCIFMDDKEEVVRSKINGVTCPPNIVEGNLCLEYIKYIVLPWFNEFKVDRSDKHGGNKIYTSIEELNADYESGKLHPADLKPSLSKALNKILQPVRDHFENDPVAKDLLSRLKKRDKKQKHSISSSPSGAMDHSLTLATPSSSSSITVSGSEMSAEEKFRIVRSIGEECIQDEELLSLLANKPQPICYDGFEPSGRMHIAQGVMKTINVNKLTSAGCKVKILIADYFALLNNKMNGDLKKIEVVGQSMIETWKAVGMNMDQVEFLWSSNIIKSRADEYLPLVFDIGKKNSVKRVKRCCQIMGRSDGDEMPAAQILYPLMQCADIFFLKANICQLGMDQRKVNVLAREYCDDIKRKNKPIILSHHMLPGLNGQEKMSKSVPDSSIFMDDDEKDVIRKINDERVQGNPCLEYIKFIVFPWFNEFKVDRSDEHGGNMIYTGIEELNADYESGQLHLADLKTSLSNALNKILQPVRDHKKNDPVANDLFSRVKGFMESKSSNLYEE